MCFIINWATAVSYVNESVPLERVATTQGLVSAAHRGLGVGASSVPNRVVDITLPGTGNISMRTLLCVELASLSVLLSSGRVGRVGQRSLDGYFVVPSWFMQDR